MRTQNTSTLLAALALSFACPVSLQAADPDAREALRRRIDFERSVIVLAAKVDPTGVRTLDRDAFVARLLDTTGATRFALVTGDPPRPKRERKDGGRAEKEDRRANVFDFDPRPEDEACGIVRGRTERHAVQLALFDGSFLVRDAGRYDPAAVGAPSDAKLAATTRRLLAPLGAGGDEDADFQVRTLIEARRMEGTPGTTPLPAAAAAIERAPLAKKVFVRRSIGGVPVPSNGAVASFGLDGTLRKLRGRWTTLDASKSQLASDLDRDAFVERALDVMIERKVPLDSTLPIYLETYFAARPGSACGTMAVDLRGIVAYQTHGPDGAPGRVVQLDFDV